MAYLYLRGKEVYLGFTDKQGVSHQTHTDLPALEHPTYKTVGGKRQIRWPEIYRKFLFDFEHHIARDKVGIGEALSPDFSFEKLFAEFIECKKPPVVRPSTITQYELAKKHLVAFYPDPTIRFLTPERLVKFRNHLLHDKNDKGKVLTATSVNSYFRSLSAFYTWVVEFKKALPESPVTKQVQVPPDVHQVPNFTDEQLTILLDSSISLITRNAIKGTTPMYDLIRFLLLSGFRIQEAVDLQWSQVHFNDGYIALKKKDGSQWDSYPLNTELRRFLESLPRFYTPKVFRYKSKSYPSHFVTHLSQKKKWGLWRDAVSETDDPREDGRLSIHTLRKNFGTYMAGMGVPPYKLQELMRHSNFSTTQKYYLKVKMDENRMELNRHVSLLAHVEGMKRSA